MIRAGNCVTFTMKLCHNYMYEYVYIQQAIHVSYMVFPLELFFRNNYSSNGDMCRDIIKIKYIQENR